MPGDLPLSWGYHYSKSNTNNGICYADARKASLRFARIPLDHGAADDYQSSIDALIAEEPMMAKRGLYFLTLAGGRFYIGKVERQSLKDRVRQHIANYKDRLLSMTIATSTNSEGFEDEEIKNLEALLIQKARDEKLPLDNVREESYRINNRFLKEDYEQTATFMLEMFVDLNKWAVIRAAGQFVANYASAPKPSRIAAVSSTIPLPVVKELATPPMIGYKYWISIKAREPKIGDEEIYKYVVRRDVASQGYRNRTVDIFTGDLIRNALFLYLYEGKSVNTVDRIVTRSIRHNGYIAAATLNYYAIESNRKNRGILKDKMTADQAEKLIDGFVSRNTEEIVLKSLS